MDTGVKERRPEDGHRGIRTEDRLYYTDIGRAVLGPLLAAVLHWLLETCRRDCVNELFFLSRDSFLLYAAYRRIGREIESGAIPDAHYLCVSRKSLGLRGNADPEEIRRCRAYLLQEGVAAGCGIVDIGWHGSTAERIALLCGIQNGLYSYYLGDLGRGPYARAFLRRPESLLCEGCLGVWEILFREDAGEEICYRRTGDRWSAVRSACKTSGQTELLRDMREEAVREAVRCFFSSGPHTPSPVRKVLRIGLFPSSGDLSRLGSLMLEECGALVPLAGPCPAGKYLLYPRLWLRDYHRCLWKCGFLAEMGAGPAAFPVWLLLRTLNRVLLYPSQTCYNIQDPKSCIGSPVLPGKQTRQTSE